MKKSEKKKLVALITMAVAFVGAILAVVGAFIDFITFTFPISEASTSQPFSKLPSEMELAGAVNFFIYAVLALSVLSALAYIGSRFLNGKMPRFISAGIGALCLLMTVLLLIFVISFCGQNSTSLGKYTPAVGAILLMLGGLFSGCAAVTGIRK